MGKYDVYPYKFPVSVPGGGLFRVVHTNRMDFVPHWHPQRLWEISYVLTGGGRCFVEKHAYPMAPGAAFLVNHLEIHTIAAEKADRITVMFSPQVLGLIPHLDGLDAKSLFVDRPAGKGNLVQLEEKDEVEFLLLLLHLQHHTEAPGFWGICLGCLSALLGIVARAYYRGHVHQHVFAATEELVHEMITVIEAQLTEKLSLTDLAAKAGVSPSYFSTAELPRLCGRVTFNEGEVTCHDQSHHTHGSCGGEY